MIYVQRGADPDLLVERPDGCHVKVSMSWTDYAGAEKAEPHIAPALLDINGLRQVVHLIEALRREECYPEQEDGARIADPLPKSMLSDKQKI